MKTLSEYIGQTFDLENIFESLMSIENWEHCTFGVRDYAPDVVKWILSGNQLKYKDGLVDGSDINKIYDIEKMSKLLDGPFDKKESTITSGKTYNDFNLCLLDKKDNKHKWQNIDKTYFREVAYSKSNKGNKFEPEFESMLKNKDNNMLSRLFYFLSSYNDTDNVYKSDISIETSLDGSKNSKRTLTNISDDNGTEIDYVRIQNANPESVGATLSDITVTLKNTEKKPVLDPVTNIDRLYLSLKSGSTISLINPGVKNANALDKAAYDFNYADIKDVKTHDVKFGKLGNLILDTFGINPVCFCYVFNNRRIQSGGKFTNEVSLIDNETLESSLKEIYGKVTKTDRGYEVDASEHGKKIHDLIKQVVGNGYVIVHNNNGKIHFYDLRDESLASELIGDKVKSAKIIYPHIGSKDANTTSARVVVSIEVTDNLSIEVVFRNGAGIKKDDPYPSHAYFMYKISKNFQNDRQQFDIEKEIKKELTEK